METNISMQKLKQQRLTPAEKFVLNTIKGAKAGKPYKNGNVEWFDKDGKYLFEQMFSSGYLWVNEHNVLSVLGNDYDFTYYEKQELLTKLLYKYTNNGQLKVV
jgi:hypothetical protein